MSIEIAGIAQPILEQITNADLSNLVLPILDTLAENSPTNGLTIGEKIAIAAMAIGDIALLFYIALQYPFEE